MDRNNKKNKKSTNTKQVQPKNRKEDDIMSAVARNYVYQVKVKQDSDHKENIVSKEFLEACKKVADKYPKK